MNLKAISTPMPYEEIENEGPILVFLHGFPNNYFLWKDQIAVLKENYHILNFNLPGSISESKVEAGNFRTHFIQETILDVMKDRLKTGKKFFLIGHDLGCFILDEVGRRFSANISGQIYISGMGLSLYASKLKSPSQLMKSYYAFLLQIPGVPGLARTMASPLRRSVFRKSNIPDESSLYSEAPEGFGSIYLYQELGRKLIHVKRNISYVPTHFIFGSEDKFLNAPALDEISEHYQFGDLTVIRGGHWINREKPSEVNKAIIDFLSSHSLQTRVQSYENQLSGIQK